MSRCQRCYQPKQTGPHGLGLCPLEPRNEGISLIADRRKFALEQMGQMLVRPGEPPIRLRSTKHYRQILKSRGLTDDISHKELVKATWDDSKREQVKREGVKQFVNQLEPAMRQRDARWLQQHKRSG